MSIKLISKYLFILLLSIYMFSCVDSDCGSLNGASAGNCIVFDSCKSDSDCNTPTLVCDTKNETCRKNPCSSRMLEDDYCGMGHCVYDENYIASCKCDENTIYYIDACIPKCTEDSTCEEFASTSKWETYRLCNETLGHCLDNND